MKAKGRRDVHAARTKLKVLVFTAIVWFQQQADAFGRRQEEESLHRLLFEILREFYHFSSFSIKGGDRRCFKERMFRLTELEAPKLKTY